MKFPSFEPGTDDTLLDSKWAKAVKRFIEAFFSFSVVRGAEKDELKISDRNVVLSLKNSDATELHYDDETLAIDIDGSGIIAARTSESIKIYYAGNNGIAIESGANDVSLTPEELYISNGTAIAQLNADGELVLTGATAGISLTDTDTALQFLVSTSGGDARLSITDTSTGKSLTITLADITQNMTVREIDVCDAGVAKKMLVLASAPY